MIFSHRHNILHFFLPCFSSNLLYYDGPDREGMMAFAKVVQVEEHSLFCTSMLPQRCASLVLELQCQTLHLSRSIVSGSDRPFLMLDFYRRPSPAPNQLYFLQVPWVAMRSWSWPQIGSNRSHWEKCPEMSGQMSRSLHQHLWKSYSSANGIGLIQQCPKSWLDSLRWRHFCILPWRSRRPTTTSFEDRTFCSHIASKLMSCQYWYPLLT